MWIDHCGCIKTPYEVHVVILGNDHVKDGRVDYLRGERSNICWVSHPIIATREQCCGDLQLGQVIVWWCGLRSMKVPGQMKERRRG